MKTFQVLSVTGGKVVVQRFASHEDQDACHRALAAVGARGLRQSRCPVSDEETLAAMSFHYPGLSFAFI